MRHDGGERLFLFLHVRHLADPARADDALVAAGIAAAARSLDQRVAAVELKADLRPRRDECGLAPLLRAVEIKPVRRAGDEGKAQRDDVRAVRVGKPDAAAVAGVQDLQDLFAVRDRAVGQANDVKFRTGQARCQLNLDINARRVHSIKYN